MLRPCASVYDLCPFARICFSVALWQLWNLLGETIIRQS